MWDSAGINIEEEFLPEERKEFEPPERLTVSQWADKYRMLEAATSAEPGPWSTSRTPYLKMIMDTMNDPQVEEVVVQSATQVGKTETLFNILGYIIDQRPGPTMIVYPTVDVAEDISRTRIQPMIRSHRRLSRKAMGERHLFTTLRMQFVGMDLFLSGANSAASLASKPCEFVLLDEVNKYPYVVKEEADPVSLAKERTKTFPYSKKIYMVSTPTTQYGRITREIEDCDEVYIFQVKCPFCDHFQKLEFKQVKWPEVDKDHPDREKIVEENAYYECVHCQGKIEDRHKPGMLASGKWVGEKGAARKKKVGFKNLSSLYSPWVKFGQMAVEFVKSKPFPEKLQNFVNAWLGEPWIERAVKVTSGRIYELRDGRPRGIVPADALALLATVDVQKIGFYYVVRAFGRYLTSWLVTEGFVTSFESLDRILWESSYPIQGRENEEMVVRLACMDSGYRTDEVYDWVRKNKGRARAFKGSTHPLNAPYKPSRVDYTFKGTVYKKGLIIWLIDTDYWKNALSRRMQLEPGEPGSWMVHDEITRDYAEQMESEEKIIVRNKKTGEIKEEWRKVSSHAPNHYWDAEVYALAAADMLGVQSLRKPLIVQKSVSQKEEKTSRLKPKVVKSKWMQASYY